MGGSGGRGYFSSDPRKVERELEASRETTEDQEYQAASNQALQSLLTEFNNRNADAIGRRLDQVKDALSQDIEGTIDLRFGGSVAKHTFVDGLSDVDSLVLLNKSDLVDLTPAEVKKYFAEQLQAHFPDAQVTEGRLAVTVRFDDIEIQLLPALRTSQGYRIPNATGPGWADVRPQGFTHTLTNVNAANGSKVVPVIKLAKAILGNLPERQQLTGYHVEALAVQAFREYKGQLAFKDMLHHFFAEASSYVRTPFRDPTGQSEHVDDYLGGTGSLERRLVGDALDRIARRIRNADSAQSVEQITALFEA